jgi:creatinine amidohydrolase
VRIVVLLSGHFPQEQADLVGGAARELSTGTRKVIGLTNGMVKDPPIRPDHAALFETSLMHALAPSLVHLDRLPSIAEAPADDPEGNPWGEHRHDPSHVLHGIFGDDPRLLDANQAEALLHAIEQWLVKEVVTAKVELGLL